MSKHAVVWLDHKEARIFNVHPDHVDEAHLHAPSHQHHKHPTGAEGSGIGVPQTRNGNTKSCSTKDASRRLERHHEVLAHAGRD